MAISPTQGHLVLFIAAIGTLYAAWSGFIRDWPYTHGDTRWFYAAGVCLNHGLLPYSVDQFKRCWLENQENFNAGYLTPFSFGPVSLPFASLIAAFPWNVGKWIFAVINLVSTFLLIALAGRAVTYLTPRYAPLGWLFFAALGGSISGSVHSGQGSILAALGFVLALNGLLFGSVVPFVFGTLLATIKFNIVPLLFFVLFFVNPREMIYSKLAAGCAVAASAFIPVLLFGPEAVTQWYSSAQEYLQSPINQMASNFGLPPLLTKLGFGKLTSTILPGLVAVLITLVAIRAGGRDRLPELLLLAGSLGMLAIPFKSYDLAVIMTAMMLTGCTARPLILAPALILLWRPEASSKMFNALTGLELHPEVYVLIAFTWVVVILASEVMYSKKQLFPQKELNRKLPAGY
jgi:hypothetical protein